jgi:hypothetical protein
VVVFLLTVEEEGTVRSAEGRKGTSKHLHYVAGTSLVLQISVFLFALFWFYLYAMLILFLSVLKLAKLSDVYGIPETQLKFIIEAWSQV